MPTNRIDRPIILGIVGDSAVPAPQMLENYTPSK